MFLYLTQGTVKRHLVYAWIEYRTDLYVYTWMFAIMQKLCDEAVSHVFCRKITSLKYEDMHFIMFMSLVSICPLIRPQLSLNDTKWSLSCPCPQLSLDRPYYF